MHEAAARQRMSHGRNAPAHPLITKVVRPSALFTLAGQPGVIVSGAQNQGVELLRAARAKHRELKPGRPVTLLEDEAERVFGRFLRLTAHAAVDAQPAAALERQSSV